MWKRSLEMKNLWDKAINSQIFEEEWDNVWFICTKRPPVRACVKDVVKTIEDRRMMLRLEKVQLEVLHKTKREEPQLRVYSINSLRLCLSNVKSVEIFGYFRAVVFLNRPKYLFILGGFWLWISVHTSWFDLFVLYQKELNFGDSPNEKQTFWMDLIHFKFL